MTSSRRLRVRMLGLFGQVEKRLLINTLKLRAVKKKIRPFSSLARGFPFEMLHSEGRFNKRRLQEVSFNPILLTPLTREKSLPEFAG
jgi:hypothetical protein